MDIEFDNDDEIWRQRMDDTFGDEFDFDNELAKVATGNNLTRIQELLPLSDSRELNEAFHLACFYGHLDVVKYLLEKGGVDIYGKSRFSNTCLYQACDGGQKEVALYLAEKGGPRLCRALNGGNESALYQCCASKNLDIFGELIYKVGFDLDADYFPDDHPRCTPGWTILHEFWTNGYDGDLRQDGFFRGTEILLREYGLHVDVQDSEGETPFMIFFSYHLAAVDWEDENLFLFINSGADLNLQDNAGETLLSRAIHNICVEAVKWLLDLEASIGLTNSHNQSTLLKATSLGAIAFNDEARILEIVRLLLQRGAVSQINHADDSGDTPLVKASQMGRFEVVKVLLDHGASDLSGALIQASSSGHVQITELLLDHGASDQSGALTQASSNGHVKIVELLLKREFSTITMEQVWLALEKACEQEHLDVIFFLHQYWVGNYSS